MKPKNGTSAFCGTNSDIFFPSSKGMGRVWGYVCYFLNKTIGNVGILFDYGVFFILHILTFKSLTHRSYKILISIAVKTGGRSWYLFKPALFSGVGVLTIKYSHRLGIGLQGPYKWSLESYDLGTLQFPARKLSVAVETGGRPWYFFKPALFSSPETSSSNTNLNWYLSPSAGAHLSKLFVSFPFSEGMALALAYLPETNVNCSQGDTSWTHFNVLVRILSSRKRGAIEVGYVCYFLSKIIGKVLSRLTNGLRYGKCHRHQYKLVSMALGRNSLQSPFGDCVPAETRQKQFILVLTVSCLGRQFPPPGIGAKTRKPGKTRIFFDTSASISVEEIERCSGRVLRKSTYVDFEELVCKAGKMKVAFGTSVPYYSRPLMLLNDVWRHSARVGEGQFNFSGGRIPTPFRLIAYKSRDIFFAFVSKIPIKFHNFDTLDTNNTTLPRPYKSSLHLAVKKGGLWGFNMSALLLGTQFPIKEIAMRPGRATPKAIHIGFGRCLSDGLSKPMKEIARSPGCNIRIGY